MTLDEVIKREEELVNDHDRIKQIKAVTLEECRRAEEHRQLAEWLKELKAHREAWEKCIKEIKEWYWNADKQAIAKDPCVVDAMVDLFIRTIKECRPKEGDGE